MRILVMDDDAALGAFLQKGLALEGHDVHLTADAETGLRFACERSYDMIVVDLAEEHGLSRSVLSGLREYGVDASVLLLTSRSSPRDRVAYLDEGADDVLLKPISFAELTARCRVVMRRRERFADPTLRHGDLELNRIERRVVRAGRVIDLTAKEFALLEYLMLSRGRICSRGELMKEVWQNSADSGTNVVDVYVNYLRKKLALIPVASDGTLAMHVVPGLSVIDTIRGEGYALASHQRLMARQPLTAGNLALHIPAYVPAFKPSVFAPAELAHA
jgi:DNA-binding response OmpR family regulator